MQNLFLHQILPKFYLNNCQIPQKKQYYFSFICQLIRANVKILGAISPNFIQQLTCCLLQFTSALCAQKVRCKLFSSLIFIRILIIKIHNFDQENAQLIVYSVGTKNDFTKVYCGYARFWSLNFPIGKMVLVSCSLV